ncbi:MAG TPA: tRNA-dihydrouridine synthase [Candidatus Paceibacterota bacterium]
MSIRPDKPVRAAKPHFWQELKAANKPIFVMAPMANVTDSVFRKLFAKFGAPDVTWTEFVSSDGLISPGREVLMLDLVYSRKERPIVAQLFTGHPEAMRKASKLAAELGFDGIDINMGCPDRAVEKQGGGSALIRTPKVAVAILEAARAGVRDAVDAGAIKQPIPVSVKTRLGYNKVEMEWLRTMLEQKPPTLTVHLRTRKEMSLVDAHWDLMPEIVKLRNEVSPETVLLGNGDVQSIADGAAKIKKYGCDGVMIGRGIFGKPWLFENIHAQGGPKEARERTPEERLKTMVEHSKMFEKAFKGVKSFAIMRKHFKAYVNGWPGAAELRAELMLAEDAKAVALTVKKWLVEYKKTQA